MVGYIRPNVAKKREQCLLAFLMMAAIGLALDSFTKHYVENSGLLGSVITSLPGGMINITLVHNSGAAWGIFGDSTFLLGVFSLVICAIILGLVAYKGNRYGVIPCAILGLIFAGGLGNALDRFLRGYVVDFIQLTFVDFPVFNVADIFVTIGLVCFFISVMVAEQHQLRS